MTDGNEREEVLVYFGITISGDSRTVEPHMIVCNHNGRIFQYQPQMRQPQSDSTERAGSSVPGGVVLAYHSKEAKSCLYCIEDTEVELKEEHHPAVLHIDRGMLKATQLRDCNGNIVSSSSEKVELRDTFKPIFKVRRFRTPGPVPFGGSPILEADEAPCKQPPCFRDEGTCYGAPDC